SRDWSSDVCSSDLINSPLPFFGFSPASFLLLIYSSIVRICSWAQANTPGLGSDLPDCACCMGAPRRGFRSRSPPLDARSPDAASPPVEAPRAWFWPAGRLSPSPPAVEPRSLASAALTAQIGRAHV